jgi:hypothetical protein
MIGDHRSNTGVASRSLRGARQGVVVRDKYPMMA